MSQTLIDAAKASVVAYNEKNWDALNHLVTSDFEYDEVATNRKAVGAETLIGREAVVTLPCRPVGQVRLDGEIWEARCEAGASPGDRVRVTGREKLTLIVEPVAQRGAT